MDRSTDYSYGPPLRTTPQIRMKKRKKYFSYGLSNRLCRRNFKLYILQIQRSWGSSSGASWIITHCHFLCCGHTVYERQWKSPGSLQEASGKPRNLCSFPSTILFSPFSRGFWTRSRLHNLLSAVTDTNKLELPKNSSSIVRLSHECNVTSFLLFASGISLRWVKLIGFFFRGGGGKKGVNYICTV